MNKIINQNILDVKRGLICHQVNCQGVMGAGLAKQIKDKYPKVYRFYKDLKPTVNNLGDIQIIDIDPYLSVCNLFAQKSYGKGLQTDYDAFEQCLINLHDYSDRYEDSGIYFPYGIGCGLAGGDWEIISSLIFKHFPQAIICKLESTEKTVLISGSRSIKTLSNEVKDSLDRIIELNFKVVIGDASGVDRLVQSYLKSKNYSNVTVYYATTSGCRNNLGFKAIAVKGNYTDRDVVMCQVAEYGLAIWDGKSKGTLGNINRVSKTKIIKIK